MRIEEVDLDAVVADDLDRLVAFDRQLWAEEEPGEPALAERVVAWMHRSRPNTERWAWRVDDDGEHGIAGLAVLRAPLADNLHLGQLLLQVAPGGEAPGHRAGVGGRRR